MIGQLVHLPDAPTIPGLRFRMFDPGRDYEAYVAVLTAANLADDLEWLPTVESMRHQHEHIDEFDPRRDILLAEIDGTVVAAAETDVRTRDGWAIHQVDGFVAPAWRRRGLGRAMLHWTERRAAEVATVDGRTGPRAFSAHPDRDQAGAVALYESEGYRIVRYGFLMLRDLREPIADRALPAGLRLRPVDPRDHRAIWDADVEAFRDHPDRAELTDTDFVGWFSTPELDPGLWRVAWDGDQVAGSVMAFIYPEENETLGQRRGWLEHVSVRRPWRRRGLASALITDALRGLRDAGMTEGALGVDAENPTGALGVYEALGFRRARTGVHYRKEVTID